ncbi:hypothetical protein N2152v2_007395 [Parachlorella kessleri]
MLGVQDLLWRELQDLQPHSPRAPAAAILAPPAPPTYSQPSTPLAAAGGGGQAGAAAAASFTVYCNQKRAKSDALVDWFVISTYGFAIARWWHAMPAHCVAAFVGHLALSLLRQVWYALSPGSYLRWREVPVAIQTAATLASPIPTVVLLDMARALGDTMTRLGLGSTAPATLLAHPAVFMSGVFFVSRAQKMAIMALGYRTRLWLHLPLHTAMLVLCSTHMPSVCAQLLKGSGPERTCSLAVLGMWRQAFSTLSALPLLYSLPTQPPVLPPPTQQESPTLCSCVLTMIMLAAGYLLPMAANVVWESREWVAYRRQQAQHELVEQQRQGAASREAQHGVGRTRGTGVAAGEAAREPRVALGVPKWLAATVYESVWELAGGDQGMGWHAGVVWVLLLGAIWLGISSTC